MNDLHYQRGQTLIETALILPLVLLAIFIAIYFSQLNVVAERAQLAVRYGGVTSFLNNGGTTYSAQNIYDFYANPSGTIGGPSACPTPPTGAYSNSAPYPGPQSSTFWQPQTVNAGTCTQTSSKLGGCAKFIACHFFAASDESTSAVVQPAFGANFLSGVVGASSTVSASENFVHTAYPANILACTGSQVFNRAYSALYPASTPPPAPSCH